MKKFIYYLAMLLVSSSLLAKDPFNAAQRKMLENDNGELKSNSSSMPCLNEDAIKDVLTKQIKILGFIQYAENQQLLILYPNQNVLILKEGEKFLQQYQLEKIEGKQVKFSYQQKETCQSNPIITIKF